MDTPNFPTRFDRVTELPGTALPRAFRAYDQVSGAECRLLLSGPDELAALAMRQQHLELARLGCRHLATAIAVGPLDAGHGWYRAESWVEPAPGAPSVSDLAIWLHGWLAGLAELHDTGRVHGDLHPHALGFSQDGTSQIASLGRGWRIGQPAEPPSESQPAWAFMAPEMGSQGRVDARTDLFMLGAVVLYWLTGARAPRAVDDLAAALDALPADLAPWADLLGGLLAPSPDDRFSGAGEALLSLPGAAGLALPAPLRRVAPFVGRRQELARLFGALDEAVDTLAPRVVTLSGEAGVGKSRLLEELRQRARARGCAVVRVSAVNCDGAPYAAFVPLLETLMLRVPLATRLTLGPTLAAVLPGLGNEAPLLEPRAMRTRLFAAIADLIEAAATPPGLLICIDDWHAADPASQDLLDFLARALPPLPLCLVLASRQAPREGGDGLVLGGLTRKDAGALCRGLWDGKEPGGGVLSSLEELSCGNPGLLEQGALACRAAMQTQGRQAATALLAQATLPATLSAFWRSRLLALPAQAQIVARAAAVAGPRAGLSLLMGLVELEEETFLEAVETLADAGVLTAESNGYTLNAPEENVLALAESPQELAEMHGRALGHLRLASQLGTAVAPGRLAYHALESGRAVDGAYYALAAGKQALKLFALAEAETFLTRGADGLAACPEAPTEWHLDYTIARGDLERYLARGTQAETFYRSALDGHALGVARRSEVLTSLGIALNLTSRSAEAEALYREAAALDAGDAHRARAITALARMHVRLGRAEEAVKLCRQVLALKGAPAAQQVEVLGLLGLVCVSQLGDTREGLEHLARAQKLATKTGDRLALANACMLAGNARFGLGQLDPARQEFSRYALLCQELGLPDEALCASLNLAQVAYEQGRFVEAWQRARTGAEAAAATGNKVYEAFGLTHTALAGVQLGYIAEAESAAVAAAQVAESLGDALSLQVGVARLELAVFLGRFGGAEELALALRRQATAAGVRDQDAAIALALGQVYAMSGEVTAAVEQLRQARNAALGTGNQVQQALVELGFGHVALASGQIAVAQARGLDALALAEASGTSVARLRAHLLVAQTSWQLGLPESTDANLNCAQELAIGLASPYWQAISWLAQSRLRPDGAALRLKATTYIQFYLQQLPPRARQEFLNWPERRDALTGRGTSALELRVAQPPLPRQAAREARS